MSTILDALRRAERERHLGQPPSLSAAPLLDESRSWPLGSWLGAGLGLGLGLSAALLAFWWNRPVPPSPPPVAIAAAPVTPPPVITAVPSVPLAPPVVARETPRAVAPVRPAAPAVIKPPPPAPLPPAKEPVATVVAPEPPHPVTAPVSRERRESAAKLPITPGSVTIAPASEVIPPLDTLPTSARRGLPALNLDIHIYSADPNQRFVVINGRRYREGERLNEGLVLEAVTGDGAVLRQGSQRFRLSVRR